MGTDSHMPPGTSARLVREMIVGAFMPWAKLQEHVRKEIDHHWPGPAPDGCQCQKGATNNAAE